MRQKFTVLLLLTGLLMFIFPLSGNRSFVGSPEKLLTEVLNPEVSFSVDQVAKFIVSEDSTFQLIDLRTPEEYKRSSIPGSLNIPYAAFISNDPDVYLNNGDIKNIFYSDSDFESNFALVYSRGLGYRNCFVMEGGLGEWKNIIMESRFTGERISVRENALYEIRTRARKLYEEMNSLPDSLKSRFIESKKFSKKKLDGGCE